MVKIGFEVEAFLLKDGQPILVPNDLPKDECGWLVEVRSEPHTDVTAAIYLLHAEGKKVERRVKEQGYTLEYQPLREIPRELKVEAARRDGKGRLHYQNVYGHHTHRNSTNLQTASTHVSFTNEVTWYYTNEKQAQKAHRYPGFVDHAKLILGLDRAFKQEIQDAKRNPGFYEVKPDGRIEYRSLPNNIDFDKLETVLLELLKP